MSPELDLFLEHPAEYTATPEPVVLETAPATFLAIDGRGEPGSAVFHEKLDALLRVAGAIRNARRRLGPPYALPGIEALWWCAVTGADFWQQPPASWRWRLLNRLPADATANDLNDAVRRLQRRERSAALGAVALATLHEGLCVQVLHTGSFAAERETLDRLRGFAAKHGFACGDTLHEIHRIHPRRVEADRRRVILRLTLSPC